MKVKEYSYLSNDENGNIEVGFLSIKCSNNGEPIPEIFLAIKFKNYTYKVQMTIKETEKLRSDLFSIIISTEKDFVKK